MGSWSVLVSHSLCEVISLPTEAVLPVGQHSARHWTIRLFLAVWLTRAQLIDGTDPAIAGLHSSVAVLGPRIPSAIDDTAPQPESLIYDVVPSLLVGFGVVQVDGVVVLVFRILLEVSLEGELDPGTIPEEPEPNRALVLMLHDLCPSSRDLMGRRFQEILLVFQFLDLVDILDDPVPVAHAHGIHQCLHGIHDVPLDAFQPVIGVHVVHLQAVDGWD